MKPSITILCLHLAFCAAYAQKEDRNWVFGINCGIDFNDLSNPRTFQSVCHNYEANASISDSAGNLLFYLSQNRFENYFRVRNDNHDVVINGDSILGSFTTTNGVIILPVASKYYIFSVGGAHYATPCPTRACAGLFYSVVEKDSNEALKITAKNVFLFSNQWLSEKLSAVKHSNGVDWWVLVHYSNFHTGSNSFYKFLLTPTAIEGPFGQNIGTVYSSSNCCGEMTFSSDGTQLVSVSVFSDYPDNVSVIDLFNFDRCNGLLYNHQVIDSTTDREYYGVEFSRSGKYIYTSATTWPPTHSFINRFSVNPQFGFGWPSVWSSMIVVITGNYKLLLMIKSMLPFGLMEILFLTNTDRT